MTDGLSRPTKVFAPSELDLNALEILAQTDPQAFEAERQRLIDRCIDNAPEEDRAMLRRVQFRADGTRRRARTPLQSSLQMAELMWSAFYRLNDRLNAPAPAKIPLDPFESQPSAPVLPLRPKQH